MSRSVAALATASGQAAETLAITTLAAAGDEIISSNSLYGGTYNLFHYTLPRLGINVRFVDPDDFDAVRAAINPKTRAIYAESLGNPKLDVIDKWGKVLTVITVVFGLVVAALYVWANFTGRTSLGE